MRRKVVAGIVLACAAFMAGGAVQGHRQAGIEAAPTRTVTPVEVTNFPALQTVSGQVQVGNLPVDADGNLRVTGTAPGPSFRWIKIADGVTVTANNSTEIGPFDVGGWQRARVYTRARYDPGNSATLYVQPRFGPPDAQFTFWQEGQSFSPCCSANPVVSTGSGAVEGPDMRVLLLLGTQDQNGTASVEMWLYLSN